jgi:23S rRNA (adenine2503-C2)-methyltransferase
MDETPRTLTDYLPDELTAFVTGLGERRFRAKQLLKRAWQSAPVAFDEMVELPAAFRELLHLRMGPRALTEVAESRSADGNTVKRLLATHDGHELESVWMSLRSVKGRWRTTACVSTQIGCAFGCSFCASGKGGLVRSLRAAEIAEQVVAADGSRPGNVVLMGMGEPLSNYDEVIAAIRIMNAPWGPGIGARRITVSTIGLTDQIGRLAREGLEIELAISLHAPNDEIRSRLCPGARHGVDDLIAAARDYHEQTGRVVTFEYTLIAGINDSKEHAAELGQLLRGRPGKVNLIPWNDVDDSGFARPREESVGAFLDVLVRGGITTTVRRERGGDVDAACGQLRWRRLPADRNTTASRESGGRR